MENQILYLPIGVPTFDMEVANEDFRMSIENLKEKLDIIYPDEPLLSIEKLRDFLKGKNPDLVVLQNLTFANSDYAMEVQKYIDCPIVLWTLKERFVDGHRLRLNSLTGAYSASNLIYMLDQHKLFYIFGQSDDSKVTEYINSVNKVVSLIKSLSKLNIASVGNTPDGFGFGQTTSIEMLKNFGAKYVTVESRELMEKAESYSKEDYKEIFGKADSSLSKYDFLENEQIDKSARLYKAYKDYIEENNIGALSSRCWPDFFTRYKTPVCGILSLLNDQLIAAACEGDIYGALSMFIGNKLSDKQLFFGDPVHIDENENLIYFWHCGMGACSLSNSKEKVGVHPNRKMGPTMEFVSKPEKEVTIFRVGKTRDNKFRFFISKGEAIEKEKPFYGTSVVVKLENDVKEYVNKSVNDGWEPHFTVIYKNVVEELKILAKMLNIEFLEY